MSIESNNIMDVLNVAHITLEYKLGVGGIKSVTTGLIPELSKKAVNISVITPFYDVYNNFYNSEELRKVATFNHIYKGKQFQSDVWQVCTHIIDGRPIYHYLVKPVINSTVSRIFEIGNEKDMYRSFPHSEAQNRVEYFNGAVASMVRMPNANIPEFDVIHGHTWHTGLTGCLVKEFENLLPYQELIQAESRPLKKIPYVISTIHMLLKGQHGALNSRQSVANFLASTGFPSDFSEQFPNHSSDINPEHLKQISLTLLYADHVNTVSKGLVNEAINGNGEEIDNLIQGIHAQGRMHGITNGITFAEWDPTNPNNLQEYTFNIKTVRSDKQRLKNHLVQHFPNLDPSKKWFIFIGRFANEKGVEYLSDLLASVKAVNGNLIILGSHVVTIIKDGKLISRYQDEIDAIKKDPDAIVIDDPDLQKQFGKKLRAATDCAVSLSKNEACGLVPMELMSCGAIAIVPNIQGLPDTVKSLLNDANGTGFLYDGNHENRANSLQQAIIAAVDFLNTKAYNEELNAFMAQLITNSRKFDWSQTPSEEYRKLYSALRSKEVITFDKIRCTKKAGPLLSSFNAQSKRQTHTKQIKVWQIGFNKAGSTTLFQFFAKNRVPSVHYGLKNEPIADAMYENFKNNIPLVDGKFDKFTGYFDMEDIYADVPLYIGPMFFKELDKQYPGSKFILNTRDKEAWIKSRLRHEDPNKHLMYIDVMCEKYHMTAKEVIAKWSQDWDEHHAAVLEYFKDRPADLLVFDIDNDSPVKICDFFKDYFKLDASLYGHHNKTAPSKAALALG